MNDPVLRFKKNRLAVFCLSYVVLMCLIALFAPLLSPYPFDLQNMGEILSSPNSKHWLGTDALGRDMLSRLIYGARMSMSVGVMTAFFFTPYWHNLWGFGGLVGWFYRQRDDEGFGYIDFDTHPCAVNFGQNIF